MNIIEQKLKEAQEDYMRICSNEVNFLEWIEKALKEVRDDTIKAMLVEENKFDLINEGYELGSEVNPTKVLRNIHLKIGFNQCCALQKKKAEKIKSTLTTIKHS